MINDNPNIEWTSNSLIEYLPAPSEIVEDKKESIKVSDNKDYLYCVITGDTIERVAAKFKMTPTNLVAMNKLHSRTLFINQKLKVKKPAQNDIDISPGSCKEGQGESSTNSNCVIEIKVPSSDEALLMPLHYEFDHLKVTSKYITDSEGIIKGKLLLTSMFFTFMPAFSDPVIMEYGDENYTVHLPNNKIACVSMYNNSEMMAYKRSQRKDMISKGVLLNNQCEWVSMNNDKILFDLPETKEEVIKDIDRSLTFSLDEFLNRSDYIHDIEKLKNIKFVDHKYLCVVASPRYRKIKPGYQREDEYWFMVPTDRAQSMMDYFLTHAQTRYDISADVDPSATWTSEIENMDVVGLGRMVRRNSFAKVDDVNGPIKKVKHKLETAVKKLRKKSMQWEIVNTDIDFCSYDESKDVNSKILDSGQIKELMTHMPPDTIGATWELIYTTNRDGWSLGTLYRNVYNSTRGCCLLLIKDSHSKVFGALCNSYIRMSTSCYGNGTTFIFRWNPNFEKFSYSSKNHFLLYGQPDYFSIGFSNCKNAIRLEKTLFTGITQPCDTFDSPALVNYERFDVVTLEVWSFY